MQNTKLDINSAIATALTKIARKSANEVNSKTKSIFKDPVPYTQKSAKIYKARADKFPINSRVLILDKNKRGTAPATYLQSVYGNPAIQQKPSEKKLILRKKMKRGEHIFRPNLAKVKINVWRRVLGGVDHYNPDGPTAYFIDEAKNKKLKIIYKIKRYKKSRNKLIPEFYIANTKPTKHTFKFDELVTRYVAEHANRILYETLNETLDKKITNQISKINSR